MIIFIIFSPPVVLFILTLLLKYHYIVSTYVQGEIGVTPAPKGHLGMDETARADAQKQDEMTQDVSLRQPLCGSVFAKRHHLRGELCPVH